MELVQTHCMHFISVPARTVYCGIIMVISENEICIKLVISWNTKASTCEFANKQKTEIS